MRSGTPVNVHSRNHLLTFALASFSVCFSVSALPAVDFETDIRPIFEKHCVSCHGHELQRDGIAFHKKATAFRESDEGHVVIVPGKPEESWLIKMITHEDEDARMPKDKRPLPEATIALLKDWIKEGAEWPDDPVEDTHWAYLAPSTSAAPKVLQDDWPRGNLDRYVLAAMESKKMVPQAKADPETLLRRLHLDVIGLPPDIKTMDAFIADPSDAHYEAILDRLLASPAFGERWAVHWLDLSRTADSDGYQRDGFRTIWPYRDYVINAFNSDMPYDQFVTEQLAGDLLENPTAEQKIATVFSRNVTHNREAGTDIYEDRHKQIVDRVNTFGTVFLGSSLACAQCHTHKYDPYTIREYYELFAFFNNTPIESKQAESGSAITTIGPMLSLEGELADSLNRERLKAEAEFIEGYSKALEDESILEKPFAQVGKIFAKNKKPVKNFGELKKIKHRAESFSGQMVVPIMTEMDEPRVTTLFKRGNWTRPGAEVKPAVPAFLNDWPEGAPANRLGLAQWVTSKDNPLIARAAVNRYWAEIFGQGIVTTPEDLGRQGALPSHPEVLDYLAVRFMESGWSTKAVIREMLMSATYQQQSSVSPAIKKLDPLNTWLSRGPRFRLNAELVRDNILHISGLLSDKRGGPSVMPPQPENVWRVTGNVDNTYRTSTGDDRYRRGIYTVWRRHAHYPSFANFDAPSRAVCSARRTRSNTPLQALTLMNDPVYVEAAKSFADLLSSGDLSSDEKLVKGFRLAASRMPTRQEVKVLKAILKEDTGSEYDGWFSVATALINMSATITKE